MPSRTHDLLARVVPRVRRSRELDTEPAERARVERWHATLDRSFPTALVPRFGRRFSLVTEQLAGFPVHVMTPRHVEPVRTVLHLHGGGYMAPTDPFHVRFLARLAEDLQARVVVPDYPLAPEHTWRDSFEPLVGLVSRWADPARASSTPLSMISHRQCIRPRVSVEPMYMPGRLRTASSPSRTRRWAAL